MNPSATLLMLLSALLAWPSAGPAGGPELVSVEPSEGSTGTVVSLAGSGFGEGKPKVFLQSTRDGKRRKLVVEAFGGSNVTCRLKKAVVGDYDVVLRPKGKGMREALLAGAFTVREPAELTSTTECAAPGDGLELRGRFFGTRKGSVRVGGKKAKVLSWETGAELGGGGELDRVLIRLPGKKKNKLQGTQDVCLRNRVGETSLPGGLFLFDEATGLPSDETVVSGEFGLASFEALPDSVVTEVDRGTGQTHLFAVDASGASLEFRVLYDPEVDGLAVLDGLEILGFTYQQDGLLWVVDYDAEFQSSISLTLDARCPGVLIGDFSGVLRPRLGEGSLTVASGELQATWQAP